MSGRVGRSRLPAVMCLDYMGKIFFRTFVCALLAFPTLCLGQNLVSVGDHKLEVDVRGSGLPVVVLESGQGQGLSYWNAIQTELAGVTTVVSYSRSGYEASEYSLRREPLDTIGELRKLLRQLKLEFPLVLVGHSLGGWFVRTYAAQFPEEVAAVVLVDATPDDQQPWLEEWPHFWDTFLLNVEYQEWLRNSVQANQDEEELWMEVLQHRGLSEAYPQPNIPTAVVTATKVDTSWLGGTARGVEIWKAFHKRWTTVPSNALHIFSDDTGHMIPVEKPDLVVDAVMWALDSVR